jgi:hypothetical protein
MKSGPSRDRKEAEKGPAEIAPKQKNEVSDHLFSVPFG